MAGRRWRARRDALLTSMASMVVLSTACVSNRAVVTESLPVSDVRVRIELPGPRASLFGRGRQTLIGTLVGRDSTGLDVRVRVDGPPLHVPISSLRAAYRSAGPRSRARASTIGAVRGGAVGVVSGLIMAAFVSSRGESVTRVVVGRAAGGAALGIALGLVAPGEKWRRVRLPTSSSAVPSP